MVQLYRQWYKFNMDTDINTNRHIQSKLGYIYLLNPVQTPDILSHNTTLYSIVCQGPLFKRIFLILLGYRNQSLAYRQYYVVTPDAPFFCLSLPYNGYPTCIISLSDNNQSLIFDDILYQTEIFYIFLVNRNIIFSIFLYHPI